MHRPDIKAGLLLAGYNQHTLAASLHVTPSAVSRVISGEAISARIAEAIASVQGKTAEQLWPGLYSAHEPQRTNAAKLTRRQRAA